MIEKDVRVPVLTNVAFVMVIVLALVMDWPFVLLGAVAAMIFIVGPVMLFLCRNMEVTPEALALAKALRY